MEKFQSKFNSKFISSQPRGATKIADKLWIQWDLEYGIDVLDVSLETLDRSISISKERHCQLIEFRELPIAVPRGKVVRPKMHPIASLDRYSSSIGCNVHVSAVVWLEG